MSGHSHWSSIKRQKEATDKKRGKIFSKISRKISVAAREGGGDPDTNSSLGFVIEKAKEFNMPKDTIERAIKKGTGELEGIKLEPFVFEAFGPGKIALIIEGITDNKNRTFSDIKQLLGQFNGKLADEGSVKWLFERKGVISINFDSQKEELKDKEKLELEIIESGAEDLLQSNENLEVYSKPEELQVVKKFLEEKEIKIEAASLGWIPKKEKEVEEKILKKCQELFEALEDNDAVQEIYSNLKI